MSPVRAAWMVTPERGSRLLLRLMAAISLRLGRRASRVLLHAVTAYFFIFSPRARRTARRYLQRALGRPPRLGERYRHLWYFATTIHDRLFLANGREELFDVSIEGAELMRAQRASGRGAILIGAHLGSFEIGGTVGRRIAGVRVSMAMYEENARKISQLMASLAINGAPDILPLGRIDSMLRVAEHLDAGAFVGILADRTIGTEALQEVNLLGDRVHLPTGAMRVAAATGSRVIFMAGLYRGANRYHVVFTDVADFAGLRGAARKAAVAAGIEHYARLLDQHCRADPCNWFNFHDFWDEPGRLRTP